MIRFVFSLTASVLLVWSGFRWAHAHRGAPSQEGQATLSTLPPPMEAPASRAEPGSPPDSTSAGADGGPGRAQSASCHT